MPKKRILFYVHFNKHNKVEDYVIYQLQQMRPIFDKVILLSNSKVFAKDKKKFAGLYDKFIQRENKGFDFAAWRDGMNIFGWDKVTKYDELTVMNDTCFGPFYNFKPIYNEMQSKKVDFWGMTTNIALKGLIADSDGKSIFAPIHIQSYYITFNKKVIMSEVFKNFWTNVENYDNVQDVITNYEIKLTEILSSHGFTYDSYYNAVKHWKKKYVTRMDADVSSSSAGNMKKYNPGYTCVRPLWLLTAADKYPFMKTKAVYMATSQMSGVRKFLLEKTKYPIELIDSYMVDSFFDIINAKDNQIKAIESSKSHRIGLIMTAPARFIKRLLGK